MVYHLLLLLASASAQCTIESNGFVFDFSSLSGKQANYTDGMTFVFTFCEPVLCSNEESSICRLRYNLQEPAFSFGVWTNATNWQGSTQQLTARFQGGTEYRCDNPRYTNVTFKCVEGLQTPEFAQISSEAMCELAVTIEVPSTVCVRAIPCCTPSTYTATRVESDRTTAVVQADGPRGMWFDQNYKSSGKSMLCSRGYGRCFSFDSTSCVGSDYQPAPLQCFGGIMGKDWESVASGKLFLDNKDIVQSSWMSAAGDSVTTLTLSPNRSECLTVYGANTPTSFGFGVVPNASLWEIPRSCLKQNY